MSAESNCRFHRSYCKPVQLENLVTNQGERVHESERPGLVWEHKERYLFALSFIKKSDRVLDCACGTGYGSQILSRRALEIIGLDISPLAITYCRENYSAPNMSFRQGNAESLEIQSGLIDAYCSFETIEHVPDPIATISEARRVLKPQGTLFISTPNRVFSGLETDEKPHNPFHLREWSLLEFRQFLKRSFNNVTIYAQRVRSPNKFHPKYVHSKFLRLLGVPDFIQLKNDRSSLEKISGWVPMVFLAVCRK